MDGYELLRIANILLSVALLMATCHRITRDWPQWTRREKVVRVHLIAYLFVIAYGTTEALAAGVKPGPRVLLVFLVHASFALALMRNRRDPVH